MADTFLILPELARQEQAYGFLGRGWLLDQVDLHPGTAQGVPGARPHASAEDHRAVVEQ